MNAHDSRQLTGRDGIRTERSQKQRGLDHVVDRRKFAWSGIDLARSGVGCLLIEVCDGDLCGFAGKDDGDFLSDAEILIVVSVALRRSPIPQQIRSHRQLGERQAL